MNRTRCRWFVVGLAAITLPLMGCSTSRKVVHKPEPRQPEYHVIVHDTQDSHEHVVIVDEPGGPPPHAPAHGYRRKHQFMYYPGANVYYDTQVNRYFWIEDGTWVIGAKLPKRIVLDAEGAKSMSLDPDRPFDGHKRISRGPDKAADGKPAHGKPGKSLGKAHSKAGN